MELKHETEYGLKHRSEKSCNFFEGSNFMKLNHYHPIILIFVIFSIILSSSFCVLKNSDTDF
jgi:hypothetical protein